MDGTPQAPCRLAVYLARESPVGVVLRRGPSAWARLSVWHTDTDTFEHGQWLKGRIYERRCDLSADGALFVYFARKDVAGAPADSWVAVSRPPWFSALALWFIGSTWYTGGFFPDRDALWLGFDLAHSATPDKGRLPPWLTLDTAAPPYVARTNNWTERTVYVNRLLREGWQPLPGATVETWALRHPDQPLTLVMTQLHSGFAFQTYGGPYLVEYAIRSEPQGPVISLGPATWASWDHRGRLVIAQHGHLFHRQPDGTRHDLADFNAQAPEPLPSPGWAATWPDRPPAAG